MHCHLTTFSLTASIAFNFFYYYGIYNYRIPSPLTSAIWFIIPTQNLSVQAFLNKALPPHINQTHTMLMPNQSTLASYWMLMLASMLNAIIPLRLRHQYLLRVWSESVLHIQFLEVGDFEHTLKLLLQFVVPKMRLSGKCPMCRGESSQSRGLDHSEGSSKDEAQWSLLCVNDDIVRDTSKVA